ncbi:MAG: FAD-binding protein [candidate division Zixibacteria bacterium]|nr:FAD-binding protein [candidate division Zixibacteria bacterium]
MIREITDIIRKTLPAGRVFFTFEDMPEYTKDATEEVFIPDALFFAESEEDIVDAVNLCQDINIPLVIRGAGTGYSGGALATQGGLIVSIERMDNIDIDSTTLTATVGPGAITGDVMRMAEAAGLFYPPDPASYLESTIGGNIAENAGGLRCKKYGVTKDYTVAVRGVDADGNIIASDYQSPFGLMDLFIGSEGTLFIFTEITVRLIEQPKPGKTILALFDAPVQAASVVADITAEGIVPCILEFMDGDAISCSNEYNPENRIETCAAMLLIETDGNNAESEAARIETICRKYSPVMLQVTEDVATRKKLWDTRRNLSKAVKQSVAVKTAEDVCVPPSRLPELVEYVQELGQILALRVNCYGHAGDGNLHVNFLGMKGTAREKEETTKGIELLFKKTLALGGTLTGEHGIGITKQKFLSDEFDVQTLSFMRRLKNVLDNKDIINPGKIFEIVK